MHIQTLALAMVLVGAVAHAEDSPPVDASPPDWHRKVEIRMGVRETFVHPASLDSDIDALNQGLRSDWKDFGFSHITNLFGVEALIRYEFHPRFSLGLEVFSETSSQTQTPSQPATNPPPFSGSFAYYARMTSLMLQPSYRFNPEAFLKLYASLGLGVGFFEQDYSFTGNGGEHDQSDKAAPVADVRIGSTVDLTRRLVFNLEAGYQLAKSGTLTVGSNSSGAVGNPAGYQAQGISIDFSGPFIIASFGLIIDGSIFTKSHNLIGTGL